MQKPETKVRHQIPCKYCHYYLLFWKALEDREVARERPHTRWPVTVHAVRYSPQLVFLWPMDERGCRRERGEEGRERKWAVDVLHHRKSRIQNPEIHGFHPHYVYDWYYAYHWILKFIIDGSIVLKNYSTIADVMRIWKCFWSKLLLVSSFLLWLSQLLLTSKMLFVAQPTMTCYIMGEKYFDRRWAKLTASRS